MGRKVMRCLGCGRTFKVSFCFHHKRFEFYSPDEKRNEHDGAFGCKVCGGELVLAKFPKSGKTTKSGRKSRRHGKTRGTATQKKGPNR